MENSEVVQEGYRKELEAQTGPFHGLVPAAEERDEAASDEDSDAEYENDADDIISLYDETSWNLHAPMHRPMSAVLFGENVLSPFLRTGRGSLAGSVIAGWEKRFSRYEGEEAASITEVDPEAIELAPSNMKLPPGMPSSIPRHLRERPSPRPQSAASQKRMLGVISYNRPVPMSLSSSSRPTSRRNSLPKSQSTSRKNSNTDSHPSSRRNPRPSSH